MSRARFLRTIVATVFLLGVARQVSADPVRVTQGHIQVSLIGTDFLITTSTDVRYGGEHEVTGVVPTMLSGMSGDIVNLSSTFSDHVSLSIFSPQRQDVFARAAFDFRVGNAAVPPLADVMASLNGVPVFAPFAFTGSFTLFSSFQDALANVNPVGRHDLFGRGTAQAVFRVQMTNTGERLPDLPLISSSVVYRFGEEAAPVPEPGTMILLIGGMAATAARVRRRQPQPER